MKALLSLLFLAVFGCQHLVAQIGSWRDHFSYANGLSIADAGDKIYCATELGVIVYSKEDNSVERLSKATALSDIGLSSISYSSSYNTVIIGYSNGNVDLIKDNVTVNMADIARNTNIIGDKTIYDIHVDGELAYLACGFGIVVLNIDREEVKESYFIGPNGTQIRINGVVTDGTTIWATTEANGLLNAPLNSPNLGDFNNWSAVAGIPAGNGPYNNIEYFDNNIYINYRNDNVVDSDTLYYFDGSSWSVMLTENTNTSVDFSGGRLTVCHQYTIDQFSAGNTPEVTIFNGDGIGFNTNDAVYDGTTLWTADGRRGLVRVTNSWATETIQPDGPAFYNTGDMEFGDRDLWIVPSRLRGAWNAQNDINGVASFIDDTWTHFPWADMNGIDSTLSFVRVAVDPTDNKHVFLASWEGPMYEVRDNQVVGFYDQNNSSLQINTENNTKIAVGGVDFDSEGNLWVANSATNEPISVYTADGSWRSYNANGAISNRRIGTLMVDRNGTKWVINKDNGILVFNDRGTLSDETDDDVRLLGNAPGNGNLPSSTVNCMAEDLDGEIWVGTNEGVAVFYAPENVFSTSGGDAQQILLEQDGNIQILLETEIVTAIAIDGANRKWIGTSGGGIFLMSADGTEQILSFTSDNSPLISDVINDIAINHRTGEIFFSTDNGIVSYLSDATGFGNDFGDVYAYPNPVRETYDGVIAIQGLVRDTDVKITDISGNLVFETTSSGGTATWDGNTLFGERAKTGVYLVFCTDQEGDKTMVTKILLVN